MEDTDIEDDEETDTQVGLLALVYCITEYGYVYARTTVNKNSPWLQDQ